MRVPGIFVCLKFKSVEPVSSNRDKYSIIRVIPQIADDGGSSPKILYLSPPNSLSSVTLMTKKSANVPRQRFFHRSPVFVPFVLLVFRCKRRDRSGVK